MFNLFPRLRSLDENDKEYYTGRSIDFKALIEIICTPNPLVTIAREHGKGSEVYDTIKTKHLPVIFGNSFNENSTRSTKVYFRSSGYIYLDFDFTTVEQAQDFKESLIKNDFVAACWLSLSKMGLSTLIKINPSRCNKYQFLAYWDILYNLFDGAVDKKTKDYHRLICLAHDPDVYVNETAISLDAIYPIDFENGLNYSTPIPLSGFTSINTPVVYENPVDVLKLDFYKYRLHKVQPGNRTSTIGAISMQLIHLNPDASKKQLLNALLSFNQNYCTKPLSEKEVGNILSANLKKKDSLDVTPYLKSKQVFFHPGCKMPLHERQRIKGKVLKELHMKQVNDAVDILITEVKPNSIISNQIIAEFIGMSSKTVQRHLHENSKKKLKVHNDTFGHRHILPFQGYNMSSSPKVSFEDHTPTEYRIYEALEDLQDSVTKITQELVAKYTGLSIVTVKRNWLPAFKELVKEVNSNLRTITPISIEQDVEQVNHRRNLLSPFPSDAEFDDYVARLKESRLYNA